MTHFPVLFSAIPACDDGNQNLAFHELSTSIQLLQLKAPPSSAFSSSNPSPLPPRKTVVCLPSKNSVGSTVISIAGKDGRNGLMVWTCLNNKPTPTIKLIPPGRVVSISLSNSGTYLAAGSNDGTVMLWELSTGSLLASFDAHYKSITCLAFSADDAALITASEDSMCSVWSLPAVIDEGTHANLTYAPYVSLSDHTLPISDIHVSHGIFPDIRIFTAISTFAIPGPAHHITVDPLERFLFVSYPITTSYPTNSATQAPKSVTPATNLTSSANKYTASTVRAIPLFRRPAHAAHQGGSSLVHSSNGFIHPPAPTDSTDSMYTSPQGTSITALHLPSSICSSPMLLCGLSNGKIMHLSLPSLQPLGSTVPRTGASGFTEPVVCLSVFLRPSDLMMNYSGQTPGMASGANNGISAQQTIPARVVGMLGRTVGKTGDTSRVQSGNGQGSDKSSLKDRVVFLRLGRSQNMFEDRWSSIDGFGHDDSFGLPNLIPLGPGPVSTLTASRVHFNDSNKIQSEPQPSTNSSELVSKLQEESNKLREQLGQALRLNDAMWSGIVQGTLKLSDRESL
ncbi:hypothetical protein CROQUDRAFT_645137 [Cronartium quercuum f. sp. fusiforme G11]|uniref:Pre-rRNA-processing protein IPI3 n=1 Tax=Cronartium quercuum f. sp. fusiforme G11 TaxID=708437 RepID=A0A9P6T9W0_9BASI|nr:hypothetical protein CROQUDRAFT_645137 [Cronartium quercuum f. sp. fusiforme G11]